MSGRPVCRITDLVLFPCGIFPIITGDPRWMDKGQLMARVTDRTACPGSHLITGSSTWPDSFQLTSRIGDLAICPNCGVGVVITGDPMLIERGGA